MALGSKQKLAIIIIAIIVAVPSIGFGVYYGINRTSNNIINSTEISISSVQILSADDTGMNLSIQGTIDNPSNISANMGNLNLSVNYNSVEIGTTQVKAMSISGGNNSIDQQVFMNITNQSEFSMFLSNFVKSTTVTLSINGTASISASKINLTKEITKNVTIDGFGGLQYQLLNVTLNSATPNSLSMTTKVEIENPTLLNASVSTPLLNLTYQQSWIGNITLSDTNITAGENIIDAAITISGDKNVTAVDSFLSEYISGETIPLNLNGSVAIKLNGMQNSWSVPLNLGSNLQGINETFVSEVTYDGFDVQFTPNTPPTAPTGNFWVTDDIHAVNPFNFAINITHLAYSDYFNDTDGYTYLSGVLTGSPENNIFIDSENYGVGSPNTIPAFSSFEFQVDSGSSNIDTIARLNYEYSVMNDLYVSAESGVMKIQIGEFTATVNFSFLNIPVPNNP